MSTYKSSLHVNLGFAIFIFRVVLIQLVILSDREPHEIASNLACNDIQTPVHPHGLYHTSSIQQILSSSHKDCGRWLVVSSEYC